MGSMQGKVNSAQVPTDVILLSVLVTLRPGGYAAIGGKHVTLKI